MTPSDEPVPHVEQQSAPARSRRTDVLLGVLMGVATTVLAVSGAGGDEPQGVRMERMDKVHWDVFGHGVAMPPLQPPPPACTS